MPRSPRIQFAGARYHITCRGNGRQQVFINDGDCLRFRDQLADGLDKDGVILFAWVLMWNHFHLLIETPQANVSQFVQRLNTAYSMYSRYRHHRPGHLFQGRFGAKLVGDETYLLNLSRYIHLNPVKTRKYKDVDDAARLNHLRTYRWSSYRGYVKSKLEEEMVDYRYRRLLGGDTVRAHRSRYRYFIERGLVETDADLDLALTASPHAIGNANFIRHIEHQLASERELSRITSDVAWPEPSQVSCETIDAAVAKAYGVKPDMLKKHGRSVGECKFVAVELACRHSGLSQREIGRHYGDITGAAVTYLRGRIKEEISTNPELINKLEEIQNLIL